LLGQKRRTIASDLGIAIRTVDVYLLRIRRKVGVSSMLEVAVFFSRETHFPHSRE
jgi:DNA-binding NarL/FixJ family response regulator